MLIAKNLSKHYENFIALEELNLQVNAGDIYCLLGANGAGKTTTINFSEASLSNGLLRFGEISAALILSLLVPLLIFFWGFALIAGEREQGTLRLLLSQGVSWSEFILGRSLHKAPKKNSPYAIK